MSAHFFLSEYLNKALEDATYDKLDDGSFVGKIPLCNGVIAFGKTLRACEDEVHSTLEDWVVMGLKLGHTLPIIANIDLNNKPKHEPTEAV